MLIAASVPATAYIFLQSNKVQTLLVNIFTKEISDNLKARIYIESAKISFFNRIRLNKLYIEDQNQDTLLFAETVHINLKRIDKKNRVVDISKMEFENADIRFRIDSTRTINFQFIIDELKSNKKKKHKKKHKRLELNFGKVTFSESKFHLTNYYSNDRASGVDFSDFHLENMELEVEDLYVKGDSVQMNINDLVFLEKSGFANTFFSAQANIGKNHLIFDDVTFQSTSSSLECPKVALRFDSYKNFSDSGLFEKVDFDIHLHPSIIDIVDLAYFAPGLQKVNKITTAQGRIYGKLSNLKGKDVQLSYGRGTIINGNFNINGLPGIEDAFLYVDVKNFNTLHDDLESFILPLSPEMTKLPDNIRNLGKIQFKGKFTGFIDDFVTYGSFNTRLGNFSTDLLFKPLKKGEISYSGNLKSRDFELGELILNKNELIGKITLDANVNGILRDNHGIQANIEGKINGFEVHDYNYQNIALSGALKDNSFDGNLVVEDPNCELEFNGRISFDDELADFDFNANVTQANLYKLNIDRSDPSSFASFLLQANGTGRNLDEFNGEINLLNSFFSKSDKQIQLYGFRLMAKNTLDTSKITIRSDFLDADIAGKYEFKYINHSLKHFINKFVPSLYSDFEDFKQSAQNDFLIKGQFKNTQSFTSFFTPGIKIAENTSFNVTYDPDSSLMQFHIESPEFAYNNFTWSNVFVDAFSKDSLLSVESGSKYFKVNENIELENYSVYLDVFSDSLEFLSRWHNWDTVLYKGSINAHGRFDKDIIAGTRLALKIPSSKIIMGDSIWNLQQCNILIDSSVINIDRFKIERDNQSFLVAGDISKDKNDVLQIQFNNFKLTNFNILTRNKNMLLDGTLNGNSTISNVYHDLTFATDLHIDVLQLNNELIGDTYVKSGYVSNKKVIDIHAFSTRGSLKTFEIKGDYHPESRGMDFNIKLNKLRINLLNPYAKGIASNIMGIASGKVTLIGTINKPLFNGNIDFNKTSFKVDYLNTQYSFSDAVKIVNNNIIFDGLKIFDAEGNVTTASGAVSNSYLKDFNLNLTFNANDFLFLKTTYADNQDFYGNAYASGRVSIKGSPKDITIDVNARTSEKTQFNIPLNAEENATTHDFVRFINPNQEREHSVKNVNPRNITGIKLNFDLDITPDAEVQLIFDSKIGDIIRSRGYGAIKLEINTTGKFNMFGDYTITEGDYLFTLKNIINKKFTVDEGSYISWNGDPMDANINIKADYNTKAKLSNLFPEEAEGNAEMSDFYNSRIPVECQIEMTKRLVNPELAFAINLPTADPETRTRVANSINTEEELSKHFLSLLVINSFMVDPNRVSPNQNYQGSYSAQGALGVTTSELFSNQLSHWLSQMSNDFDIGINYRPGDAITTKEVELALSTKILNDRVSINGNLDVGGKNEHVTAHTSNIVGDFDVDVKINKSGKLHVKAFNKANDNLSYYSSDYTQGVGIFFREEFDSIEELLARYLKKINGGSSKQNDKDDS